MSRRSSCSSKIGLDCDQGRVGEFPTPFSTVFSDKLMSSIVRGEEKEEEVVALPSLSHHESPD